MSEGGPAISVVIVTYNHGRFIAEAVESVLAQTEPDRELLVVDDGSTDGTGEIVARFLPRLRYLRQDNQGAFAARNTGRRETAAPLLAFLDADDVWEPTALARLRDALAAHPNAAVAAPLYVPIDADGRPIGPALRKRSPGDLVTTTTLLLTDADVPGCVYRRAALDASGLFPGDNRYTGDYAMWLALSRRFEIVMVREALLRKRAHETNLCNDALRMLPSKIDSVERFAAADPAWSAGHAALLRRAQAKNHERLAKWCLRSGDPALVPVAEEHLAIARRLRPLRIKTHLLAARARLSRRT